LQRAAIQVRYEEKVIFNKARGSIIKATTKPVGAGEDIL
jgi:hypothetical protein